MYITTINKFKQYLEMKEANFNTLTNDIAIPIDKTISNINEIDKIVNYALSLKLNKQKTCDVVSQVFTNPSICPNTINCNYVKTNLTEILDKINSYENFTDINIPKQILEKKDNNYELIFLIEKQVNTIHNLYKQLKEKIKNDMFNCIFENNVFYINNINLLTEKNIKAVLNILHKVEAADITKNIKYLRNTI